MKDESDSSYRPYYQGYPFLSIVRWVSDILGVCRNSQYCDVTVQAALRAFLSSTKISTQRAWSQPRKNWVPCLKITWLVRGSNSSTLHALIVTVFITSSVILTSLQCSIEFFRFDEILMGFSSSAGNGWLNFEPKFSVASYLISKIKVGINFFTPKWRWKWNASVHYGR